MPNHLDVTGDSNPRHPHPRLHEQDDPRAIPGVYVIPVTFDNDSNPTCLVVQLLGNPNHIGPSPSAQTINWQLTGAAASGAFLPQLGPNPPGFAWIHGSPPGGIFGVVLLGPLGKQLSMTDLNNGPGTIGEWAYQLSAILGTTIYQTKVTAAFTTTNPLIKNK